MTAINKGQVKEPLAGSQKGIQHLVTVTAQNFDPVSPRRHVLEKSLVILVADGITPAGTPPEVYAPDTISVEKRGGGTTVIGTDFEHALTRPGLIG